MRVSLLSSASALVLAAAIGHADAAPDMTGVLELSGGFSFADRDNVFVSADDSYRFGGKAKGYWPLTPDIHLQVDLFAQQTDNLLKNWGSSDSFTGGGTVHLLHPVGDYARLGVAGSLWSEDVFDLTSSGKVSPTYALGAAEGQYFLKDWTLTAQAGYFGDTSCDNCFLPPTSGEFGRLKARYYWHDNTAITAEAMELWGSFDDLVFTNKSLHATTVDLQVEHKLEGSPFATSFGVSYERDAIDKYGSTSSIGTTTISFGLTYYYDQPTIRSNDQTGAALDTPTFGNSLALAGLLKF